MHSSTFHSLPTPAILFLLLALLLGLLIAVLQIGILGYAYEKMGITRRSAYLILFLSLVGSYYNIPIARVSGEEVVSTQIVHDSWGLPYLARVVSSPTTELSINVGGALIPTILSIYLIAKNQIYAQSLIGVVILSGIVHMLAEPVTGVGIAVPIFIPPIASAVVAMLLSRDYAAPLAYVSGCMGTLIGADIMNLHKLLDTNLTAASIGGAGTFDGVFLTGILAVVLAISPRHSPHTRPPSPAEEADDPYRAPSTG